MSTHLIQTIQSLKKGDHACFFYRSRSEQFAAVVPFIQVGFQLGEQCVYVADDNSVQAVMSALRDEGINSDEAVESGKLIITNKFDSRYMKGSIQTDKVIFLLQTAMAQAEVSGYRGIRCACEMTWALREDTLNRVSEFKKHISLFFPGNLVMLSQYNQNCFPSSVTETLLQTHPLNISEGKMHPHQPLHSNFPPPSSTG